MKYIITRISGFLTLFFDKQRKIGNIPTYEYLPDDEGAVYPEIDLTEEWG